MIIMADAEMTTGQLITEIRGATNLSKTQFAKQLEISTNYLSRLERGLSDNLSNEYALNIAKKLSRVNAVRNRDIDLDKYTDVKLAQLIKAELQTGETVKLYSSDIPLLNELNELAPYAVDEIKVVVEQAKRNKVIADLKNTLRLLNQSKADYDYAGSLVKVLSSAKFRNEFNESMNAAHDELDEKKAITAFIKLLCQGEGII
jgi:transcriptional regulator with XRE-family HTH domain